MSAITSSAITSNPRSPRETAGAENSGPALSLPGNSSCSPQTCLHPPPGLTAAFFHSWNEDSKTTTSASLSTDGYPTCDGSPATRDTTTTSLSSLSQVLPYSSSTNTSASFPPPGYVDALMPHTPHTPPKYPYTPLNAPTQDSRPSKSMPDHSVSEATSGSPFSLDPLALLNSVVAMTSSPSPGSPSQHDMFASQRGTNAQIQSVFGTQISDSSFSDSAGAVGISASGTTATDTSPVTSPEVPQQPAPTQAIPHQSNLRIEDALEALSEAYLNAVAALTTTANVVANIDSAKSQTSSPCGQPSLTLPGLRARGTSGNFEDAQSASHSVPQNYSNQSCKASPVHSTFESASPVETLERLSYPQPAVYPTPTSEPSSNGIVSFQKAQCFKTKPCRFWQEKRCTRGTACTFAHSDVELRKRPDLSKTKLCANWRLGRCSLAASECTYAHGASDIRHLDDLRSGGCLGSSSNSPSSVGASPLSMRVFQRPVSGPGSGGSSPGSKNRTLATASLNSAIARRNAAASLSPYCQSARCSENGFSQHDKKVDGFGLD